MPKRAANCELVILTVGHSTHPLDEFIRLLQAHGMKRLVDVRAVPRSRHNPQFNRDTLPAALREARIFYTHLIVVTGFSGSGESSLAFDTILLWADPVART